MLAGARTVNPRFPNAPARMADGRLFTDYRPSCRIISQHPKDSPAFGASFDDKQRMQQTGEIMMKTDRSMIVMMAGSAGSVDTMVPELTKRVCSWDGCVTLVAQPAGLGQGRLYLPGRTDLAAADPDVTARETAMMHGTFSSNPNMYVAGTYVAPAAATIGVPARPNRYSVPYGSF